MKLKMAKNSLFAILLRSPWWISFIVVAVFVVVSGALLPEPYVGFGMMGAMPFVVIGFIASWRQWHAPSSVRVAEALGQAGAMSWRDFSNAVEQAYTHQGYAVMRVNAAAADFSLVKGGRTTLVSCKRWKAASHGVEALRDLASAKVAHGADQCTYISLGSVSDNARRFATAQGVVLVSGDELAQLMLGRQRV